MAPREGYKVGQMAENSTSFSEDVGEVRRYAETQVMPRGGAWPNA